MTLAPGGLDGNLRRVQRAVVQLQQEVTRLAAADDANDLAPRVEAVESRLVAIESTLKQLQDDLVDLSGGAP